MTIEHLKLAIIKAIIDITDVRELEAVKEVLDRYNEQTPNTKHTQVRQGVTKEQLFAEAGNKQPTYEEWKKERGKIKWHRPLEEDLGELD